MKEKPIALMAKQFEYKMLKNSIGHKFILHYFQLEPSFQKNGPIAADEGVVVIDNTSQFRYDFDIPLVVPEVNPEAIAEFRNRNIIANPNCSTIQMLVGLKPIHDAVGIERINVFRATNLFLGLVKPGLMS